MCPAFWCSVYRCTCGLPTKQCTSSSLKGWEQLHAYTDCLTTVLSVLLLSICLQAAVKRVLSDSEEVVAEDVGPLLKAVVATNKFEREMAALFGGKGLKEEDEDDGLQVGASVHVENDYVPSSCCSCLMAGS